MTFLRKLGESAVSFLVGMSATMTILSIVDALHGHPLGLERLGVIFTLLAIAGALVIGRSLQAHRRWETQILFPMIRLQGKLDVAQEYNHEGITELECDYLARDAYRILEECHGDENQELRFALADWINLLKNRQGKQLTAYELTTAMVEFNKLAHRHADISY